MNKSESQTRRVRITKRMMKDALMELMEQKPLASISVTQLCALADVNRSTFYSYYSDLVELLKEIEDDLIRQLPSAPDEPSSAGAERQMLEDFTVFFGYVRKHSADFNVLLQNGNPDFSGRLLMAAMQHFPRHEAPEDLPLMQRWGYIYAMNGVIGLLRDWIRSDFPIDDRTFAKTVLQMSKSAYRSVT